MSYFTQGKRGQENADRTSRILKSAGYKHGGAVKDDGNTHISIHIGDGGAGGGGPGMADDAKKKAFMAGLAAGTQGAAPPPPPPAPPMGAGPGGPPMPLPGPPPMGGLPPGGPPMPGMKRGGRISKARTVVGPGVTLPKKTPNVTGKPPGGSAKGGASQAAKSVGPPINNMKRGGVAKKAFGGGMGASSFSGLPSTANPTATNQMNNLPVDMPAGAKLNLGLPASGGAKRGGVIRKQVGGSLTNPAGRVMPTQAVARGLANRGAAPVVRPVAPIAPAARPVAPIAPVVRPTTGYRPPGLEEMVAPRKRGGAVKGDGVVSGHRTAGIVQPGYQSGGGGGGAGRLTKTRIEKRT